MKPGNSKAIEEMFNRISSKYDFLNNIFSFGLHRFWKSRLLNSSIKWINGDAQETNLPSNQFDGILIAYGLRNLSSCEVGLREAFRVLKPGGRAGILDFRSFEGISLQGIFQKIYLSMYVVPVASIFGLGKEYGYIIKSLDNFPSDSKQIRLALDAGFKKAEYQIIAKGQMGILLLEA